MTFPEEIEIVITPAMANEEGVTYSKAQDCPIARFMKRRFNLPEFSVTVGPYGMEIGETYVDRYEHVYSFSKPFNSDAYTSCRAGKTFTTIAKMQHPESYVDTVHTV